jgi:hypothetical protein
MEYDQYDEVLRMEYDQYAWVIRMKYNLFIMDGYDQYGCLNNGWNTIRVE